MLQRHNPRALDVEGLFEPAAGAAVLVAWPGDVFRRGSVRAARQQVLLDVLGPERCAFVRGMVDDGLQLTLAGVRSIELAAAGGWLVRQDDSCNTTYWLPAAPTARLLDAGDHIRAEKAAEVETSSFAAGGALVAFGAPPAGMANEVVIWRLSEVAADELRRPVALERQATYLLGSHTRFAKLGDIGQHLIHGRVYENRYAWPFKIRICSENDAHALYLHLRGLEGATGRTMVASLALQVALSAVARLGGDGAFRHGEWTDGMEAHYRLHCSGMHLMMDVLAEGPNPEVERGLRAAAAFMAKQHELIEAGAWFFHDELEHSVERMRSGPFKWVAGTALGKRESNMLVLNTQLDATIALDRYAEITGDSQYVDLVASARAATRSLLALRSAEPLYRLLFRWIELSFLPTERARRLPAWKRALKRLAWQVIIPRLPDLKACFPRLVMPGGYIDRELTLRTWAHDYHAVNLMDLARYLRRFDDAVVRQVLLDGLAFARRSGILQRWQEMDYHKYALGFWAEALYHVCTLFPDDQYRQWLAEAMLVLEDMNMGQPPSLLGANAEAVPVAQQMPCPSPADARLRVANLGRRGAPELLLVNATDQALALDWEIAPAEPVTWQAAGEKPTGPHASAIPPRGWLWARAAH
jgi:hypothetical protein